MKFTLLFLITGIGIAHGYQAPAQYHITSDDLKCESSEDCRIELGAANLPSPVCRFYPNENGRLVFDVFGPCPSKEQQEAQKKMFGFKWEKVK